MIENILNGLLGTGTKPEGEAKEAGTGSLLPIIILFVIIAGGLKLLKAKEETDKPALPL